MTTTVARERETRPGAWVRAAIDARNLTVAEVAVRTHRDPSTVDRWRANGIDYIAWVGLLHLVGLPATWEPGDAVPKLPPGWQPGDAIPAGKR